jgi:hypothetical protein
MTELPPLPVEAEGSHMQQGPGLDITTPSGQVVTFQEVIWNAPGPEGLTLRFRFLAPAIAQDDGSVDFDTASADMLWLCQTFALPRVPGSGPQPAQIVISLSDRPVPFGQADPDATQFFEAYALRGGTCVWEAF